MSSKMPLPTEFQPLSEKDKESIENYFDSDPLANDELDFATAHGLLTACVVGPSTVDEHLLRSKLLGSTPEGLDDSGMETIINLLARLALSIEQTLNAAELPEPPCALTLLPEPDESQLRSWCIGFMEGLFLDENAWFKKDQEIIAELILPIMAVSGLFEDENDFEEFKSDSDLMEQLCTQIPETLLDLYLFFNAPTVPTGSETDEIE